MPRNFGARVFQFCSRTSRKSNFFQCSATSRFIFPLRGSQSGTGKPSGPRGLKTAFQARETSRYADPSGIIQHAVVHIGDSAIELGEAHGEYQPMPIGLHLFVHDVDHVYERALRAGAKSDFAPSDAPYGQRVGGVIEQDGNRWFIATLL